MKFDLIIRGMFELDYTPSANTYPKFVLHTFISRMFFESLFFVGRCRSMLSMLRF